MNNPHRGSSFDRYLAEEGLREEAEAVAIKRVLAYELALAMKTHSISKVEMAGRLKTSRSQLDRLLDPANTSVTLATMQKAATIVGKKLKIKLA